MDESQFWGIVDRAHEEGGDDFDLRNESLRRLLTPLSFVEIQEFQVHYETAIKWAYRWDLWAAAEVINGEVSSDGFRYFLDWMVSEGSVVYKKALESPDSLADLPPIAFAENERFGHVAAHVFESRSAELKMDGACEAWPPAGEEWIKEDLPQLLPRLSRLYKEWDWLQKIRRTRVMGDVNVIVPRDNLPSRPSNDFPFDG